MKPSYTVKAVLKEAAKPLLKQLGKGWRLKIDSFMLLKVYRPNLIYRNRLAVYPSENGMFRASFIGIPHWGSVGETVDRAITDLIRTFQKEVPKLLRAIDDAHQVSDDLRNGPASPFREALRAVCGAEPPAFVRGHSSEGYTDDENEELQAWCGSHYRPHWATNLSMIEAAELIVASAVDNANIEGPE